MLIALLPKYHLLKYLVITWKKQPIFHLMFLVKKKKN